MSLRKKDDVVSMDLDTLRDHQRRQIEQTPGLSIFNSDAKFDNLKGLGALTGFLRSVIKGKRPPKAIVFIDEIEKMLAAGNLVAETHRMVRDTVEPGLSTLDLDVLIRDFVLQRGGQLLFYRYKGFPANSCISINEEVVHGIPRERRKLKSGDVVSVDIGVKLKGYCGDSAWTYKVGELDDQAAALMAVGEESLSRGIAVCRPGGKISDIGRAIQTYVEEEGYHVVKKYVGHGVSRYGGYRGAQ